MTRLNPILINIIANYLQLNELPPFFKTHNISLTTPFTYSNPNLSMQIIHFITTLFPSITITHVTPHITSSTTISYTNLLPPQEYKRIKKITHTECDNMSLHDINISPLKSCINLTTISLPKYSQITNIDILTHLKSLKSIDISASIPIHTLPPCRHLTLRNCAIPHKLSDLNTTQSHLSSLHISSTINILNGTNINNFYLPHLKTLHISLPYELIGIPKLSKHLKKLQFSYHHCNTCPNLYILSYYPSIRHLKLHTQNLASIPTTITLHHLKSIILTKCYTCDDRNNHNILETLCPNIERMTVHNTSVYELNFINLKKLYVNISSFDLSILNNSNNLEHVIVTGATFIKSDLTKSLKCFTIINATTSAEININTTIDTLQIINVQKLYRVVLSETSRIKHTYIYGCPNLIITTE